MKMTMKNFTTKVLLIFSLISCSNSESSNSLKDNEDNKMVKKGFIEKSNHSIEGRIYHTFLNGVQGYQISVPVNWLYENINITSLRLHNQKFEEDDDFIESIVVVSQKAALKKGENGVIELNNKNFTNFYKSNLDDLTKSENLDIFTEGSEKINNQPAKYVLLESSKKGEELHILKYFIATESKIHILTGTCKKKDYPNYARLFLNIIGSFKMINQ